MSVLHQNSRGIGKSIPPALEICRPQEISQVSGNLLGVGMDFPLPRFVGVRIVSAGYSPEKGDNGSKSKSHILRPLPLLLQFSKWPRGLSPCCREEGTGSQLAGTCSVDGSQELVPRIHTELRTCNDSSFLRLQSQLSSCFHRLHG